jgi:hypothetical protein
MAEEQTAGTPGAEGDGAATATAGSGTPPASKEGGGAVTVDASELKKLQDIREQFLREKDNTERTNRENEMLRQEVEQARRAPPPPTGYDPAAEHARRIAQSFQNLQERDPEAAELITETARITHEQMQRQAAESRFDRELGAVPAADREEVERIARADRLPPSFALERLKSRRFDKEMTELAEQRRRLQENEDKRKRGVVDTTSSPAPPASQGNSITAEQYARASKAAAGGDTEALKTIRGYDAGRITIRDG